MQEKREEEKEKLVEMWADWTFPHGALGGLVGGGRGQAHTKLVVSVI